MRKATIKRFTAPDYSGTEAINTICTNLSFSGRNCKRIAFTSYMPGAGKTYISVNVLYNLAKRGKRVLLVDADLRRSEHRFPPAHGDGWRDARSGALSCGALQSG